MKPIHKFYRKLKTSAQYILCSGKRCDFSEHVAYQWKAVTCGRCQKLKKK